jgi:hypothetical protein
LTLCIPLSSTRRERFKDDTISGRSSPWSAISKGEGGKALQALGPPEGADDGGDVLVLAVDGVVEAADVGGGEFAG